MDHTRARGRNCRASYGHGQEPDPQTRGIHQSHSGVRIATDREQRLRVEYHGDPLRKFDLGISQQHTGIYLGAQLNGFHRQTGAHSTRQLADAIGVVKRSRRVSQSIQNEQIPPEHAQRVEL